MYNLRGYFLFTGLALGLFLLSVACSQKQEQTTAEEDAASEIKDSLVIELEGVDSVSVFDLLKEKHLVEYHPSLQGVFVTAIDSVSGGDGYFWIYAVNDTPAQVACDKYITKNGDTIKWLFRKR